MVRRSQISPSVGRPREFELDVAVRKAMGVFWDRGYHDASLPDLLEGMELSRGSFYKAFVDKRGVYLRALDVYIEDAIRKLGEILHANPSPKAAIREAFSRQVDESSGKEGLRGLLCRIVGRRNASHGRRGLRSNCTTVSATAGSLCGCHHKSSSPW